MRLPGRVEVVTGTLADYGKNSKRETGQDDERKEVSVTD